MADSVLKALFYEKKTKKRRALRLEFRFKKLYSIYVRYIDGGIILPLNIADSIVNPIP